ncbi:uncharacterized protein TNCV_763901 [Trichonephila clavipes]|nr:uncharacterized protein TNCV_763901 [Trichonephila clavipes]
MHQNSKNEIHTSPQQTVRIDNFILLSDGVPPHWSANVRDDLDEHLPHRWIRKIAFNIMPLSKWPPRNPDITVHDFFLWGCEKDNIFTTPLSVKLKQRITANIDEPGSNTVGENGVTGPMCVV